jgi:glycosyltransferase involved in cell wall biosynthesis
MLGYLSGTDTHDHDFGAVAEAVGAVMRRHDHVYLTVIGPLELPALLSAFGTRVRRCPFLAWQSLPHAIAQLDVNLAPLDLLQPFNHAKSEVKWLEAAALGVVTIASRAQGLGEAVRHGETGLLANTPAEWDRMLEDLVTQPELRARLGEAARREVEQRYRIKALGPKTAQTFMDIAQHYTRFSETPSEPVVVSLPRRSRRLPLAGRLRRVAGQTVRNVKRLLNPFFWERVLDRWEGKSE